MRYPAVALALLLACAAPARAQPLAALEAGLSAAGAAERVEILFDGRPPFRLFTLDDPPRLVADLPPVEWRAAPPAPPPGFRLAKGLRFGVREGGGRLVVDLLRPARVARASLEAVPGGGGRLRIDLAPETATLFAALAGWPEAARRPEPEPPRPPGEGVVVMIDPGHGGADPGALSRGLAEKDLTLDYARALAAELARRPGFTPVLTRDGDEYVSLRDRVSRARAAGAAVFLSLHADALASGEAAGASVYTLSDEASGKEAAALAEGHERGEALSGLPMAEAESDVAKALLDLSRRRTDARSRALAERLVAALAVAGPVLEGRALQSAGFRVLRAPDFPSALIELGFMSSAADRERLTSDEGRGALARALADGLSLWADGEAGPEFDARRAAAAQE